MATLVKPSVQILTDASSLKSISVATPYHYLVEITLHLCTKIPFLAPAPAFAAENPSESSIIHGISAFQVHRTHLQTFVQYFPSPCILAPSSGISRYRNSAPNLPISKISATTPDRTWRNERCNQSSWSAFPLLTHKFIDQVGKVPT